MKVLVVGSVALDTVRTPFGSGEEVLGGSAVYFSVSASFFAPVRLVAAVGEDFDSSHVAMLRGRNVDLEGLRTVAGRTFRWEGEYGDDLNTARTLRTELGVLGSFRPHVPESFRDSEIVFLANVDPEAQSEVLSQMRAPRLVACDTMNFWIEGKPDALRRTLRSVDVLLINDAEARQLSGESSLILAARAIRGMGPGTVVVKRGEYGAMMFRDGSIFSAPAYPVESVKDPTGAGDSFAGGFIGSLARAGALDERAMRRAIVFGSVMASLNVEEFSLGRLLRASEQEIQERFREFRALTWFEQDA